MTINHSPDAVLAEALAEQRRTELENAARAVIGDREYFNSRELERLTGTPSSTWRYWASGLMVTEMQRGTQLHSRISRVVAVNQMKKVNAVLGFTRLDEFDRVNDVAHRLVKLTRNGKPTWMPATEDRGEGIFLQLNVSQVEA